MQANFNSSLSKPIEDDKTIGRNIFFLKHYKINKPHYTFWVIHVSVNLLRQNVGKFTHYHTVFNKICKWYGLQNTWEKKLWWSPCEGTQIELLKFCTLTSEAKQA